MSQSNEERRSFSHEYSLLCRGVIHDVKNKLHFILNNHDYMEESLSRFNTDISEEFREIIEENREGLREALKLIMNSLDDSGELGMSSPLSPEEILDDVIGSFGNQLAGVHIKRQIGIFSGKLMGSEERLGLIFSNLIGNSLQCFKPHGEDEKTITIKMFQQNRDFLSFVIDDNGPGIPGELLDRVFESGFTTRKSSGGSGQGLDIVRNLVEKDFGGRISLSSDPGKGTAIHFDLPLVPKEERHG